jgi:hypothetical protein
LAPFKTQPPSTFPDQLSYNATSARQLLNQTRDVCRIALTACPHQNPYSMLIKQFR